MRIQLLDLPVIQARELEKGFDSAVQWRADAMMVMASTMFFGLRTRIADLAIKHRLPAVYDLPSELIINMKAAKALGLTIPLSLLQRADQVIE